MKKIIVKRINCLLTILPIIASIFSTVTPFSRTELVDTITFPKGPYELIIDEINYDLSGPDSLSFTWMRGSEHTISMPSPQPYLDAPSNLVFTGWNDGNVENPRVVVSNGDAIILPIYDQYWPVGTLSSDCNVEIWPNPGPFGYLEGSSITLTATPWYDWIFDGWLVGRWDTYFAECVGLGSQNPLHAQVWGPYMVFTGGACPPHSSPMEIETPIAFLSLDEADNILDIEEPVYFKGWGYAETIESEGIITSYLFDFGDDHDSGWTSNSKITHSYDALGTYWAKLKVEDSQGRISDWSKPIKIQVAPSVDFEILVSPDSHTVQVGDSVTCIVSLIPKSGFDSAVTLDIPDPPLDISYSFDPPTITPMTTSTLVIATSPSTQLITSSITITGTGGGITKSNTLSLETILLLEIGVEKFCTKTDVAKIFFRMAIKGVEECRAPRKSTELEISRAWEFHPGPLYLPYSSQPTFPLEIEIKAFSTDLWGVETEIDKAVLTISSIDKLPHTQEFDLSNIYMKAFVKPINPARIPDPYYPNGITKEGTPNLDKEWYWFAVGADKVWNSLEESDFNEVVVAVLDTGVDYTHPALNDVIWLNHGEIGTDEYGNDKRTNWVDDDGNGYTDDWQGYDFVTIPFGDNDPMDEDGHGTEVAGVMAAQAQTGFTAGVATVMRGNLRIMPIRVLDGIFQASDLVEGIEYAIKNDADIITMSLGDLDEYPPYLGVRDAVEKATKRGIALIAGAGNDCTMRGFYPASYDSVMSVSGLKNESSYMGFWIYSGEGAGSNYGPTVRFDKGVSVEVSAPSVDILTTGRGFGTAHASGTSVATPIVTATAAMIIGYASKKYDRHLNPNEVRYIIRTASVDLGPSRWDPYYGYGMVNAYAALQKVDELLGRKHWQIKLDPPGNIDLHVYDSDGCHVGVNYITGEEEVEILEAHFTGDEIGGWETIFLPIDVASFRIEITAKEAPEPTDYILDIILTDENGSPIGQWTLNDQISEGSIFGYQIQSSNGVVTVTETTPPTTTLNVGYPQFSLDGNLYVSSETALSLDATDTEGGSGLAATAYRIWNGSFDSGWLAYALPFRLIGLDDGAYSIDFNSTDNAGNVEPTNTLTVILDNTDPLITVSNPPAGWALQDGVTFTGSIVDSESGVSSMYFSIREANGGEGIPIGFEDLPVSYDPSTGEWSFSFGTLLAPDGYYVLYIEAEDNLGNGASTTVPYSIRNWAVLELLPASENNKARRTMPVKFTLRVVAAVDPLQPFVYNEELTIDIYATDKPDEILQESTFGDDSRDYRINSLTEVYITNFKTLSTPKEYRVEVYRKDMLIDSFTFETVI